MLSKDEFYKRVRNSALLKFISERIKYFNPNTITLVGLVFAVLAGLFFAYGITFCAVILVIISSLIDLLDGAVAKINNSGTKFGGILDSVCDRYSDAAIMVGIMWNYSLDVDISWFLIPGLLIGAVAIIGSIMVSYVRAKGESAINEKITIGIADRPARIVLIIIGVIFGCMNYAILLVAILSHLTIAQRLWFIYRNCKGE